MAASASMTQLRHADHAAGALAAGQPVIVVLGRRSFFLQAAALAAPDTVAITTRWGRGLTCFSVTPDRAMRLGLLLGGDTHAARGNAVFLRSVEAAECHGTGISAADRAMTLRAAGATDAQAARLKSPGHVLPVMVVSNAAASIPSAALALIRQLSGFEVPAWTDILNDAGELSSPSQSEALAERLGLGKIEIAV